MYFDGKMVVNFKRITSSNYPCSRYKFPWGAPHIKANGSCLSFVILSWIPWNLSFRYILFHEKKTPNDAVTPQRQSQFTPKMKANAVPHLLSSLVWIDQYNECNGMTSFIEFIIGLIVYEIMIRKSWSLLPLYRRSYCYNQKLCFVYYFFFLFVFCLASVSWKSTDGRMDGWMDG